MNKMMIVGIALLGLSANIFASDFVSGDQFFKSCKMGFNQNNYNMQMITAEDQTLKGCPRAITTTYRLNQSNTYPEGMLKTEIFHLDAIRQMDSGKQYCDYSNIPYVLGASSTTTRTLTCVL